jgi:hypothetical protein
MPGFPKRAEVLRAARDFDTFGPSIDPHGEHDIGSFDFEGTRCFWKIDYNNLDMSSGSEDPADPAITTRVLTIMRADER